MSRRPTRHCIRSGPSSISAKASQLQFSANVRCGQMAGWTNMPLGMEVGIGPGDFMFDGTQLPQKKGTSTDPILAHVYCGQTGGWIKMPLGTQLPSRKRSGAPPQFSAHFYCGKTAGCIKIARGMEVGLIPGDFVLDGDLALPLPKKGAEPPSKFSVHFYCGQTA